MINNKPVKDNKQTKPINPTQQFIGLGLEEENEGQEWSDDIDEKYIHPEKNRRKTWERLNNTINQQKINLENQKKLRNYCTCGANHSNETKYHGYCNYCLKKIKQSWLTYLSK